jgi:AraC-like DNA-binding protein
MNYQEFLPHPLLRNIVECYWAVQGSSDQFATVYPDACMDILFNLGSAIESKNEMGSGMSSHGVYVIGNMFVPSETRGVGDTDIFGIRFRASGIGKVLRVPLHEFNDTSISLSEVHHLSPGVDHLQSLDLQRRVDLLDRWLLKSVAFTHKPEVWEVCLNEIVARNGSINVHDLSRDVGISQKQMERKFVEKVGPTPKQFAQLLRFRRVRELLAARQNESMINIAFDLDFTDHAHLTKFFQKFALRTPTEFLESL